MQHKTLCFRDGLPDTTPWLRSEVKRLQIALDKAGFTAKPDGFFGKTTEAQLKAFQKDHGLAIDGVVSAPVWEALTPHLKEAIGAQLQLIANVLQGFRGDLEWIHLLEGHRGRPYWPGGESGVTLDPGVDLGYVDTSVLDDLYRDPILSGKQMKAVKQVIGLRGEKARKALQNSAVLDGVRISRAQADEIMPFAAKPYWQSITKRFPTTTSEDTLPAVQTVMLSLAYNRGANNPELEPLQEPLSRKDWAKVAGIIGSMQQSHDLEGIRKRRQWEAYLIKSELN